MFGKLYDSLRRWMGMIFGKSKTLNDIVESQIGEESYTLLDKWKAIYSGYYKDWHDVKYHTVDGYKKRRRHSLNMGKVAAEELAKLIFTDKVIMNISKPSHQASIDLVLSDNRFYKIFQNKLEQMFALGGLVLKAHPKDNGDGTHKLLINYVTPDSFVPISWENEEITEGAFLTVTRKGDKSFCLVEFHRWKYRKEENGTYTKVLEIKNELYEGDLNGQDAKQVPLSTLYPDLEKYVAIEGLTQPLFQYLKPNIANNFDLSSPLGISIFANALDTLYAIDVAFDSFIREFKLGRRRIIVPTSAVKSVVDPSTGELLRYFDAEDEVYQAMNTTDPEKQKIEDNTVSLRVTEHVAAINALLNLFSMQIGFSPGSFTFDGTGVKTATEIISENSKTYQTVKSNINLLEEGLIKFVTTITEVAALYDIFDMPNGEWDADIYWDDSIIGDKYTEGDWYIKSVQNGLMPKKRAIMKMFDLTEEQAIEWLEEMKEENMSAQPDINELLGLTGDDDNEGTQDDPDEKDDTKDEGN